ncbi:MAG: hypothetical protein QOE70_6678 [Chthoniobacter sp.]|jgi:hypothetical protein|nr:hypothetical protein [Chthoniobacter sp.]
MTRFLPAFLIVATGLAAEPIRPVPPPGVPIPDADRFELTTGVAALAQEIAALEKDLQGKPELLGQLPDVQIFHKAVDWALRFDEFFDVKQVALAKKQLELGKQRAQELRDGKPSWNAISGADGKPAADGKDRLPALVVRGYKSRIDGSIQPYGLVLPEDYKPGETKPRPLHFWCHGRGEKLSELDFINQRMTSKGDYTPPGAFVIHLYGRYCCANKFAGEVDLFEALADAKKHYPIDDARLVVRGFSMGGASAWQFGTHFAGMWAAVQPGAGFGESKEFLKLGTTLDKPLPTEWEQTLWRWYDSTGYVANLANTTTVAYSGEIDGQKQAADIMIRYARKEAGNENPPAAELGKVAPGDGSPKADEARVAGTAPDLALYHVIAPKTAHKVIAEAKPEVEKLVEAAVEKGRELVPKEVRLTTYTLRYPRMDWVFVTGLEKHWERADVMGKLNPESNQVSLTTKNVTSLSLVWSSDHRVFSDWSKASVTIDGQTISNGVAAIKFGLISHLQKVDGKWQKLDGFHSSPGDLQASLSPAPHYQLSAPSVNIAVGQRPPALRKLPALSGPIDDASMDSFVFVRPSGKPLNKAVGDWAESEFAHAVTQWRAVFRGEARVVADTAVSADDIANSNLVLWGDPSSNAVLKKIADQLPMKWDAKQLVFAGQTYDAAHHAPVLIFPNPLNPQHYVVLNSGFTFREAAALNNAQQVPKLPDWAIVDLSTPPDGYWPGKIVKAGFFDEQWQPPKP